MFEKVVEQVAPEIKRRPVSGGVKDSIAMFQRLANKASAPNSPAAKESVKREIILSPSLGPQLKKTATESPKQAPVEEVLKPAVEEPKQSPKQEAVVLEPKEIPKQEEYQPVVPEAKESPKPTVVEPKTPVTQPVVVEEVKSVVIEEPVVAELTPVVEEPKKETTQLAAVVEESQAAVTEATPHVAEAVLVDDHHEEPVPMQVEAPVESPQSPEVTMTEPVPIVPMPEQVIDAVKELNAVNEGGLDQSTVLDKPLFPKPPLFTE